MMMDRLDAMLMYLSVVDSGSLAAAARELGCSPATVTRAVARLEAMAGEQLLERTTRRLAVTEAGSRHATTYRLMLDELNHLRSRAAEISGNVVITAPELFGRLKVMPVIESFLSAYPRMHARVLLLNRTVDLIQEGVDAAIRIAELPDSSMTAIRLGEVRSLTCASPSYLVDRVPPIHPSDLADHVCIGLNEAGAHELWSYRKATTGRRARSVRVTCRLALNSAWAAIEAAERGMGIVRPLSYQVERQIAEGSLVTVLQDYEPEVIPVHLVFQPHWGKSGAGRAFINHAVPLLRRPGGGILTPFS